MRKVVVLAGICGLLALLAVVPVSSAAPPQGSTCNAVGSGTICKYSHTESYGPLDTGIVCGSGATAFDIFDSGTLETRATRYYDRDGNLTRRVLHDSISGQLINTLTGTSVPYTQRETHTTVLPDPGDFSTATTTHTGVLIFTIPHLGPVALEAGRVIEGPDGIEFRAGPQDFVDYYVNGDASAVQELCSALGTT